VDHRNFDYANNGIVRRHAHNDTEGGRVVIASEMECDQLIRENRAMREQQTGKETFRLAARVPMPEVERSMQEGWFHDDAAWARWLNDGQNRDFRVWGGRI
jgi:hypothetical protein